MIMRKLLKISAPKLFSNGGYECNNLGKQLICKNNIGRFLDIGCGNGSLTIEFAKILNSKEIYGIEYADECRFEAESKGVICRKYDLNEKWDFIDDCFDFILSSQNIGYMHNTRLYLEECYRCLKPNGQIIILTENLASLINITALIFGWQPFSTTCINGWSLGNPLIWHVNEPKNQELIEKYYHLGISGLVGHVRVLSSLGLRDLLKKVGFKKIAIYTRGYFLFKG